MSALSSPSSSLPPTLPEVKLQYLELLAECEAMNLRYEGQAIAADQLAKLKQDLTDFELTLPLVGAFSAGKSSLINAFLGDEILKTAIHPTTAVPTEIRYAQQSHVVRVSTDGKSESLTVEEFKSRDFEADTTQLLRLYLNNQKLARYPGMVLVDIPGLDSNISAHQVAIDRYLPGSLAYLVTAVVDQGLTGSVLDFLKELGGHEKPIAVALTKSDKKLPGELPKIVSHNEEMVQKIVNTRDYDIFTTTYDDVEQTGIDRVLGKLHNRAPQLFRKQIGPRLEGLMRLLRQHLDTRLQSGRLLPEDIDRLIAENESKLADLERSLRQETDALERRLGSAVDSVISHVRVSLASEVSALANLASSEQSFSAKVNVIVRRAVDEGIKRDVTPIVTQSLDHIGQEVADCIGEIRTNLAATGKQEGFLDPGAKGILQTLVALPPLPLPFPPAIPIQVLLKAVAAVALLLDKVFGGQKPDERDARHRLEEEIHNRIIPHVVDQLRGTLAKAIGEVRAKVQETITGQVNDQRQAINSALESGKQKRQAAEAEIIAYMDGLKGDLHQLGRLVEQL